MIISMYYLCLGLWSLAVQFCSFNLAHSRGHFILPTGHSWLEVPSWSLSCTATVGCEQLKSPNFFPIWPLTVQGTKLFVPNMEVPGQNFRRTKEDRERPLENHSWNIGHNSGFSVTVITGFGQYGLYKQQNILGVLVYDLPNVGEKAVKVLQGARNKWRKEALKDDKEEPKASTISNH